MHILNIIIRHHFNAISRITHQQLIIYDYDCVSVLRVEYFKLKCSSETIIISLNGPSFLNTYHVQVVLLARQLANNN